MGKLKKIALSFLFIITITGILFLRYWAYYPVENIKLSGKASAVSQGEACRFPMGLEYAVFPETWIIDITISAENSFYKDITLEESKYIIFLEGVKITEGSYPSINIDSTLEPKFPIIKTSLDMRELSENEPQIIQAAVDNNGRLSLSVSVKLTMPAKFLDLIRIGTAEKTEEVNLDLQLVGSFKISSFEWKKGIRKVNDCNPGDSMTAEFDLWVDGCIDDEVETEVIEICEDGSTRRLTRQPILEELHWGYNHISVDGGAPEHPPLDCIGYSIRLLYGDLEVWCSPTDPPSLGLIEAFDLIVALSDEGISITLRGRGGCSGDTIDLKIRSDLEVSVDLKVEPGTILINSGSGQNMVIAEARTLRLEPEVEVELTIEAYCLDMHKDNPSSSEVFTVSEGYEGYCPEAVELMLSLGDVSWEHKSVLGIQLALWAVIEDPSRDEVEGIIRVNQSDFEDAMWLLENMGIDPNEKRLFIEG
jgi:hypothetical protein